MKIKENEQEIDKSYLDFSVEPVIITDESGNIKYFNKSADKLFQKYSKSAIGHNILTNPVNPKDATFKDICDSRNANNQSMLSEFRSFISCHNSIMLLVEPLSGIIVEANKSAEAFYGYSGSNLLSMSIDEINIMNPDENLTNRIKALNGERNYFITHQRLANNEIRTVEVDSSPIKLDNRELLFNVVHDITDRQKALFSLIESEEKLTALIENTADRIWSIDTEYNLIIANQKFFKHTENLFGKRIRIGENIFPEETQKDHIVKWKELYDKALNGEKLKIVLESTSYPEKRIIEYLLNPIYSAKGRITGVVVSGRDITDNILAEEKLRESDKKFRLVVISSNDAIIYQEKSGKILTWNPAAENIFGVKAIEIIGKDASKLNWDTYREDGTVFETENHPSYLTFSTGNPCKNVIMGVKNLSANNFFWINVSTSPLFEEDETLPSAVIITCTDITEQKLKEIALHESKEKYHALISEASDGIFIADKNGVFHEVNSKGCLMLGYDENDIIGKNIKDIISDYSYNKTNLLFEDLRKGLPVFAEIDLTKKDGSSIVVEISAKILFDGRILAIVRDITLRHKTELIFKSRLRLLEYSENHTAKEILQKTLDEVEILTDSKIGFFHFVNQDEQTLSLQMWSKNTMKNMCTAKPWNEHYGFETAGVWADSVRQNKVIIHNDFKTVPDKKGMPEGHAVVSRELTIPVNRRGKVVAVLGVGNKKTDYDENDVTIVTQLTDLAWDIADNKIAHEKLLVSEEELRKLNDDKDKFFSIIAHDLRSPFTGFLGLSELMSENLSEYSMSELESMSKSLNQSAKSIFNLLTNLLEWSMVQRGVIDFNPADVLLRNVADDCIEYESDLLTKKGIQLENNISCDLKVSADINMLNTIFRNLITNAAKFSNINGLIKVSAVQKSENIVEVCVIDNGIGMDEFLLSNLFKIDGKVKRNGTQGELSSGLGLLLCKEFVEKHNCKIWAESEVGKGSRFCFTLKSV